MFKIRPYVEASDYETLKGWWEKQNMTPAWKALLPEESTYVLEIDDVPALSLCLYLMNCKDACMVENLIGNPDITGPKRKEATKQLFLYVEEVAKAKGYTTLVLFSYQEKLKQYYESLGYRKTLENVTTFAKSI